MLNGITGYLYGPKLNLSMYRARNVEPPVRSAALPSAQPDVPVQPIEPVRAAQEAAPLTDQAGLRYRWNADPAALAVQARIRHLGEEDLAKLRGEAEGVPAEQAQEAKSAREVMEESECQTCKERKYQDGSDDPGVSFKTAAHIAPEQAAAAVRGHEMEHVVRERASAEREDRKVVSQSVSYHTAICPECGKAYVSGGTTRTTTAADKSRGVQDAWGQQGKIGGFSALC